MALTLTNLVALPRGDTRDYEINITKKGDPESIVGWKFYFTAKLDYHDDDDKAAIRKDYTSHFDPENGKTMIALSKDDTDIEPGLYWYDIQAKRADGSIITLAIGRIEITMNITRRSD